MISTEKTPSAIFSEKNALSMVARKKSQNSQRDLFKIPLLKAAVLRLKKEVIVHATMMPLSTSDPKGRQKQKSTGKK